MSPRCPAHTDRSDPPGPRTQNLCAADPVSNRRRGGGIPTPKARVSQAARLLTCAPSPPRAPTKHVPHLSGTLRSPLCLEHNTASLLPWPLDFRLLASQPCAHLLSLSNLLTPVDTSRLSQSGAMASGPQQGAGPAPRALSTVAAIFLSCTTTKQLS